MPHTNAIKPSAKRWEYLKYLEPHPGRVLYTGGTYNAGRNAAKRAKRAAAKSKKAQPVEVKTYPLQRH